MSTEEKVGLLAEMPGASTTHQRRTAGGTSSRDSISATEASQRAGQPSNPNSPIRSPTGERVITSEPFKLAVTPGKPPVDAVSWFTGSARLAILADTGVSRHTLDRALGVLAAMVLFSIYLNAISVVQDPIEVIYVTPSALVKDFALVPSTGSSLHRYSPTRQGLAASDATVGDGGFSCNWRTQRLNKQRDFPNARASPAVFEEFLYVGNDFNQLVQVHRATGELVTRLDLHSGDHDSAGVGGSPAVLENKGLLFIGSYSGHVSAVKVPEMSIVWTKLVGSGVGSSPVIYDDVVYIGVETNNPGGYVVGLDVDTGDVVYRSRAVEGAVVSSPAIQPETGRLVIASVTGQVWAEDVSKFYQCQAEKAVLNGVAPDIILDPTVELECNPAAQAWMFLTNKIRLRNNVFSKTPHVKSSPVISGGHVYISSWDHFLYQLDLESGERLYAGETKGKITSSPAVSEKLGVVVVGSDDSTIYAWNTADFKPKFKIETKKPIWSSPTILEHEGMVVVGSNDSFVYTIDLEKGKAIAKARSFSPMTGSPVVVGPHMYAMDHAGYVYGWTRNNPKPVVDPSTTAGGSQVAPPAARSVLATSSRQSTNGGDEDGMVDLNIHLKVRGTSMEPELVALDAALHEALPGDNIWFSGDNPRHEPHVTLYLTRFPASALPSVRERLTGVSFDAPGCFGSWAAEGPIVQGPYGLWPVTNTKCLQSLSDTIVTLVSQFRDTTVEEPGWINDLPEPQRSQKKALFKRFGSPNVFSGFDPHVTMLWDSEDDQEAIQNAVRAQSWPVDASWSMVELGVGNTGDYGTVLRGEDFADFHLQSPSS